TLGLYDDTGSAAFSLGGTPALGETLTVTKTKDDPDGNGAFSYRWRFRATPSDRWSTAQARARGCADDVSSCTPVHSIEHPTVDGYFSVVVIYTDAIGFPHVVTTNTLGPIILSAPTGLTAKAGPDAGEVTLTWDDPSNEAITGYQVRHGSGSPFSWGSWTAISGSDKDTVAHVVSGLTAGTQYSFQLRAVAGAVEGTASSTVTATPPANDLPAVYWESNAYNVAENSGTFSPNIQVTKATTAAVTVNFTVGGTAVCGVDYTISGADCATNTGSFAIPASTKPFTNITPLVITLTDDDTADSGETVILTLTEGSGYFLNSFIARPVFTLGLYDDTGSAAFSLGGTPELGETLAVTTTKDDPDGNGTFSYRWQFRATPSDHWSAAQARARGCADDVSSCTPVHSIEHPTVDGYFSVVVIYTDAIGFPHVVTTNTLGPIILSAPTGLTAKAGPDAGEVTLTWDDPSNEAITGYQVRHGSGSPFSWGSWTAISGSDKDTVAHVVSGLTAGTQYSFQLRAVAGAVEGTASSTVTATPPANDLPAVYWESNAYNVAENSGTFSPNIQVTKATTAAVTVNFTVGGTAVCGVDYTISGADCATNTGSFAIPASTKPFTNITPLVITLTDDDTADSGETVILTLTEGSGYFLNSFIARPVFTLGLYDDTGSAAFSLGGTPALGETLTVTKTKDDPDGNGAFSYRWRFRATPSDRWSTAQARARGCADD
ncbi:MAG: fibronectin type III domain-containing protein, partial [Thiotrichales bacterium]|nr:fibronectin type III domain-containing protein [Thiotrichales bacterium]